MSAVPKGQFGNNPLTFTPLPHMEEYLAEMAAQGRVPSYIRVTKNALVHFSDFLLAEGVIHPMEITRTHVIRFQATVNANADWAVSYKQQLMKYIRAWIRWCVDLSYISDDPWVRVKVGNTPKKPKPLTDDELSLLFSAHKQGAFGMTPFHFHRREMILCLLYGWGLRVHELEALNVANMDTRLDTVIVRNKGGGTKNLPYNAEMKRIYMRWLANRARHAKPGEDALIISTTGERMQKEHISRVISELGLRAGIDINAHRLRDTCGTNLLDDDVPVERVMEILGHKRIQQTLAYSKVNQRKVAESHAASMGPRLAGLFSNTRNLLDQKANDVSDN